MKVNNVTNLLTSNDLMKTKNNENNFNEFFNDALNKLNEVQRDAEIKNRKLALGEDIEIHQVMLATEKANLALQLAVQIRNKIIESYQEIMRMQI